MSKTQKISVTNFKAISEMEIDLKGCTAIITGGNNKGKSSLLRGITDRIRGLKPELIVKQGEKEGVFNYELTSGEKFTWEFDTDGGDKLTFITKEGYKTKVTKEIVKRFFPPSFDIDKFLNDSPKEQSKQLQKIVGIDFTEIDNRYRLAYDDRMEKNKEAERYHVKLAAMLECVKVEPVDLTDLKEQKEVERKRLNDLYLLNKKTNENLRKNWDLENENLVKTWNAEKEKIRIDCEQHNEAQTNNRSIFNKCFDAKNLLESFGFESKELQSFISEKNNQILDLKNANELYQKAPEKTKEPEYIAPELPDDSQLKIIDEKLLNASEINQKAKEYTYYITYKKDVEAAKVEASDADILVRAIEDERENMIASAKMPTGITIGLDGICVDGFPLDKNQISTSKLYCAALRIASLNIGEVRTLHFDASFLDKNTLAEIEVWAEENDLQLMIERADYEAGEIHYELIENN